MAFYLHILCACTRVTYLRNSEVFGWFFFSITMWGKQQMMKQHDHFFICLFLGTLRRISKRYASGSIHTLIPTF